MIEPGPGILLIADPFLKDPNFLRTVIFLCDHKQESSFGFVLNRQYENTLDELIPELEGHKIPVFYGGPVEIDTIHFLHQYPDEIPGGQEVLKGIYWGGDFDAVINFIKNENFDKDKIRFYIGYSGWGDGQTWRSLYPRYGRAHQDSRPSQRAYSNARSSARPRYRDQVHRHEARREDARGTDL